METEVEPQIEDNEVDNKIDPEISSELYSDNVREILVFTLELLKESKRQHLAKSHELEVLKADKSPSNHDMSIFGNPALHEANGAVMLQDAIDIICGNNSTLALQTAKKVLSMRADKYRDKIDALDEELRHMRGSKAA